MGTEISVDGTRGKLLAAIRAASTPPSVDDLATTLGLHPNSVRLHAAALRDAGLIVQRGRTDGGRGRPLTVYSATARGARIGHRNYEVLAEVLVEHLASSSDDPAAAARSAGRDWGARLAAERNDAALTPLVLNELGFEPDLRESAIELRNCPFRELVDSHQGLICALHAGMLDGLATRDGGTVSLLPFTSATTCTVRMTAESD
ncbi:helix-turn-helix transcriptional regulator [Gordonia hydrophobica]|uniref:Transcriptional regulator n=1 Tax=Gordonia hydrophobica TaxID=40516 RepID=A0ABZ2TX90_9ACTN|nr:transcriptional regulator [Gordonia hydrophobica]MBM7366308.1 putative ArsR family transcriptional regulator [Gordonia hydrophobica]